MIDLSDSPTTRVDRWRPNRAGIRNIWEYDEQELHFADGRLILRGPNGSGKSNALALLLPFVLDAVMSAGRMDPFGGGRSMKTLLLSEQKEEGRGSRFRRDQRAGYVWLEFVRGDRYLTIGCGARASVQRDAEAWFFVTERRPGVDLELVPDGTPMTRSQVIETLGREAVHETAESYRTAVDRALFGVGPGRYRHLVDLLLVLRRPHLAGKLHPEELSAVLTQGLPPVPVALVTEVAASFEDLEAVRRDLDRLREARRAVDDFCPVYRAYLRTAARNRALDLLDAVRGRRRARARREEAGNALESARRRVGEIEGEREATDRELALAEERLRAVLESSAFRDAAALIELTERVADAQGQSEDADGRCAEAATACDAASAEHAGAEQELSDADAEVDRKFADTSRAADAAGLTWSARRDELASADLGAVLRSPARFRLDEVDQVRKALDRSRAAAQRAGESEERAGISRQAADESGLARDAAAAAMDTAAAALVAAIDGWGSEIGALDAGEQRVMKEAADRAGEPGEPTLSETLASLLAPRLQELSAKEARAQDGKDALARDRAWCVAERAQVAAEPMPAPDALLVRPADRADRPGAPLFACCDFRDRVPGRERAGIESALQAAGLLDAWLSPEGADGGADAGAAELDAWLTPGSPVAGPSLLDVLSADPVDGSGLTVVQVEAVLGSIALADAGIGIMPDGRFSLGPLRGRYDKSDAEFIGARAREARRLRRLAKLDRQLAGIDAGLAEVEDRLAEMEDRRARLADAEQGLPSAEPVVSAHGDLDRTTAVAGEREGIATRDEAAAVGMRREAAQRVEDVRSEGVRFGLPTTSETLDDVAAAVRGYEELSGELLRLVDRAETMRVQATSVSGRLDEAIEARSRRLSEQRAAHDAFDRLQTRADELRLRLGPDVDAPLRRRQEIDAEVRSLKGQTNRLTTAAIDHGQVVGAAQVQVESAEADLERFGQLVDQKSGHVAVLARPEVWEAVSGEGAGDVAGDGAGEGAGDTPDDGAKAPTDPTALARIAVRNTEDVQAGAESVRRVVDDLDRAFRVLMDGLRDGFEPSQTHDDDIGIVQVISETGTLSVLQLARELAAQVAQHEELLNDRDREIFERHLLTRVSETLRDLLNDAHGLVEDINTCLHDTPTASGIRVRLRWELDQGSSIQQNAVELLRKSPEFLGPDERERLRRFFAAAISEERASSPGAGYEAVLTKVLDYRTWHTFVPYLVLPTGGSKQLTRAVFRSLSGGEQSVSLHLPLFAAAAAHYNAAMPGAPRLIALDEAFAGIDEGMRADLMGLLVKFDLDVVLTGHELWGAYEQVPGVMIYDLLRRPPAEGVSSMAMRWDGARMTEEAARETNGAGGLSLAPGVGLSSGEGASV